MKNNETPRSEPGPQLNLQTENRDFGVTDEKGRAIGARVTTYECDYTAIPEGKSYYSYCAVKPGHYFCFMPHATRNGQGYGATQSEQLFATPGARAIAIKKYFEGGQGRATKLAQLRFKVLRYFRKSNKQETIATGLTIAEAKAHCKDPNHRSETATSPEALALTREHGPWFDGWVKE